jgi:hypothetical protein
MHIAADRLSVYVHTFVDHRKYREMCRDPRVSYTAWHLPPGGFSERRMLRSLQMKGWASLVTEEQDLARGAQVSRQQFPWLADTKMYDHVKVPDERAKRVFFRIDPVEAVWADHRVHPLWRTVLSFTDDARNVSRMHPYPGPAEQARLPIATPTWD